MDSDFWEEKWIAASAGTAGAAGGGCGCVLGIVVAGLLLWFCMFVFDNFGLGAMLFVIYAPVTAIIVYIWKRDHKKGD